VPTKQLTKNLHGVWPEGRVRVLRRLPKNRTDGAVSGATAPTASSAVAGARWLLRSKAKRENG